MEEECKKLYDILEKSYKPWVKIRKQLIEDRIRIQFESAVFINYLKEYFEKTVSGAHISNIRNAYYEELEKNIKEAIMKHKL